jgi:pimeloyl-ACP methyl ester carboxylesterase
LAGDAVDTAGNDCPSKRSSGGWRIVRLGADSSVAPRELKELQPQSHLVMLDGAGHFPQEDAADAVTRELEAYLEPA